MGRILSVQEPFVAEAEAPQPHFSVTAEPKSNSLGANVLATLFTHERGKTAEKDLI